MRSIKQPTYPDWVITLSQVILYIVTVVPLRVTYRARRILPQNLRKLRCGSLVVSNHQSMVDPFFVTMSLPFRSYLKILPIRFPTTHTIFIRKAFNPPFFPLLKLFGCFTIGDTSATKMASIFYIRDQLKAGKTIFLFPEGEITEEKNIKELKSGIDFFVKDCVNVMFVRLHGFNGDGRRYFVTGRHSVTFGEIFEPPPKMNIDEMKEYLEHL